MLESAREGVCLQERGWVETFAKTERLNGHRTHTGRVGAPSSRTNKKNADKTEGRPADGWYAQRVAVLAIFIRRRKDEKCKIKRFLQKLEALACCSSKSEITKWNENPIEKVYA